MKSVDSKSNRIGIIGKGGQGDRIYTINKKSVTVMAESGGNGANI